MSILRNFIPKYSYHVLMRSISGAKMGAIDANCSYFGLLPIQLMENAGAALAREIRKRSTGKRIAIVAGRGNNGGDAFVAARHLDEFEVTAFLLGRSREISTEEAMQNWNILRRLGFDLREVRDPSELDGLADYDMVVDAIFGTGIRGTIGGLEGSAIDAINSCASSVISVDVPSGLGTNKVVRPVVTITFHRPKPDIPGEIEIAKIGIPKAAEFFAGPGDLGLLPGRVPESHKGSGGRILVIGGGAYTGAPALSAMAALRAGADIVTVATPSSAYGTVAGFSPNLIVRELSGSRLSPEHQDALKNLIAEHDVVVIGMGLGREPETGKALAKIIPQCKKVVMDADSLLHDMPLKGIITPHAGEFGRISNLKLPAGKEKQELVKKFAKEKEVIILLKGKIDLISDGNIVRGNATGNPGMTVGGTGDVLAGIAGAFYSRAPAFEAAVAAAFVCGSAGDLAYAEKEVGLLATDVIEKIPSVMKR